MSTSTSIAANDVGAPVYVASVDSPCGGLCLAADDRGLREVRFDHPSKAPANQPRGATNAHLIAAMDQLREYFEGVRKKFELELAPVGTGFQRRVWEQLLAVPYTETVSYAQIARRLGDVNAVRAVGAANGANPIAIIIPCHRVIAADGTLHGYAGGLDRKRWLLDHERLAAPGGFLRFPA